MDSQAPTHEIDPLPSLLIPLFRGVLYRDQNEALWQPLLDNQASIRDYVARLSLNLVLDENEGYAFLCQTQHADQDLPRLIPKRQLSYPVSLLIALLRKKLAEHDASDGDPRLILTQAEIIDMVRLFMPETANEAKLEDRVQTHINKVIELGFLRRLRQQKGRYEVRRIIQNFVDGQWLQEFEQKLAQYRELANEQ